MCPSVQSSPELLPLINYILLNTDIIKCMLVFLMWSVHPSEFIMRLHSIPVFRYFIQNPEVAIEFEPHTCNSLGRRGNGNTLSEDVQWILKSWVWVAKCLAGLLQKKLTTVYRHMPNFVSK